MVNTEFLDPLQVLQGQGNGNDSVLGEYMRCFYVKTVEDNGSWYQVNPLARALPLFVVQLIIITGITRFVIAFLNYLKPLRQPVIIAEIIAATLVGSSCLQMYRETNHYIGIIFALDRLMLLETFGNMGLVYYLFLLGLEMDLSYDMVRRIGKKAWCIALAGTVFPFFIGVALYKFCLLLPNGYFKDGYLYWGAALTVTSLPVLSETLAKLKLLHSEVGRTAMSAALVNDIFSWIVITTVSVGSKHKSASALWVLLATVAFIIFGVYVIRPTILWMIRRTREGDDFSEMTICVILTGVLACGLITDLLGTTSFIGAYVFGLVIPHDALGNRFVVGVQGFVSDIMMPVWFALCGFRTFLWFLKGPGIFKLGLIVILAWISKPASTLAASYLFDVPLAEGVSIALLMNNKGITALYSILAGRTGRDLDETGFVIMLLAIFLMTALPSPILTFLSKPKMRFLPSKHRALQKLKPDAELRILACVHEMPAAAGIINLLEASNATRSSPICVFALQLIQLGKQATAFLIIHNPSRSSSRNSRSRADAQTEQMINAFEKLEHESSSFSVQVLTAMSPYATMHEDICSIAEDKRVTLIILPFHKRQSIHQTMEDSNPAYKDVNDNVLANAPCSIGILIDRGLGVPSSNLRFGTNAKDLRRHIVMLYVGGPDDREALAYASRMGEHQNATLKVVRFIPGKEAVGARSLSFIEENNGAISMTVDTGKERELDDCFINEFRHKTAGKKSIVFSEKMANNGDETIAIIKSMEENVDLYVVGRGLGLASPLIAGIGDWSECPELGAIGDLLVTSEFSLTASVLVVQQYVGLKPTRDGLSTPDSSEDNNENLGNLKHRLSHASLDPLKYRKDIDYDS
ncbi:hypothetical protein RJ639_028318 [Escallonia herrerae]|uniref:Cation/H+ exchanger domain-containing protein n=1 Tax=Escallonia herrerae TaxID=1293975 RepID=A0AA88X337_9ASTE|nr:hypothetical protein RJ639_028318 [Escallonia herrerae]